MVVIHTFDYPAFHGSSTLGPTTAVTTTLALTRPPQQRQHSPCTLVVASEISRGQESNQGPAAADSARYSTGIPPLRPGVRQMGGPNRTARVSPAVQPWRAQPNQPDRATSKAKVCMQPALTAGGPQHASAGTGTSPSGSLGPATA